MANPFARAARRVEYGNGGAVYKGAQGGRLVADWFAPIMSADVALRGDLMTIRARARQLVRDNSHAKRFVQLCQRNVIGPTAMLLRPRVKDLRGELDKPTNDTIRAAFDDWSGRKFYSADKRLSRAAFTRLIWANLPADGEVLIRKLDGFQNPHGFAVQLLDPDLLDHTLNRAPDANGNGEIRMGVEVDRYNAPVKYWMWNRHPSELGTKGHTWIDAAEIEHLFIPLRPGQTRGVSWFTPIMLSLGMLDGYRDAELVAARMGASKMAAIINKSDAAIAAWSAKDIVATENGEDAEPRVMNMAPGLIPELLPGQEMQWFDPKHPTSAFGPFETAILRTVAMGGDVSYTSLSGDLTNASYSSGRMGLVEERDAWRTLQNVHIEGVEEPLFEAWMQSASLTGALRLPSFDLARYTAASFKPRGWKWVDPSNEIAAAKDEIALGLNSRTRLAAEQGRDFEELLEELAHEEDLADEYGVDISGAVATKRETVTEPATDPTPAVTPPDDTGENDNGDGTDQPGTNNARAARLNRMQVMRSPA